MTDVRGLDHISQRLEQKYGELGVQASRRLKKWLSGQVPYAYPDILEKHLHEEHVDLLFDAFWQVLSFGTGGRRGRIGYGANRMNPTTVGMTVQGHCDYLKQAFPGREDLTVIVANDVRVFNDIVGVYDFLGQDHPLTGVSSRSLGKLACEIYAGNGVGAYFAEPERENAVLSTPELSFLINRLGAVGGINLSASHNPPDDNGIKVYDEFGSQPVAPQDQHLVDTMDRASEIAVLPFSDALAKGLIRGIPAGLHAEYLAGYVRLFGRSGRPDPDQVVTYTPLCGCGMSTVGDVLTELGFTVAAPPDQADPDGSFAPIPFKAPNPEVPQATLPACDYADSQGSGIVLSSDPDADRVGLEVKLPDGSWYHFDGNQIAAVLCYYLMLDPDGPQRKGLVIETLVTTKILRKIVQEAGDSWIIDDLLVGFKYIADVLKKLESGQGFRGISCSARQLVLAAEESHGVIMLPSIRDKDATPACMYLALLYQEQRRKGRTLLDYYGAILEHLGGYDNVNRSILMTGAQGMIRKDRIMGSLRKSPPSVIGGRSVLKIVDYWDEEEFGPFVSETDKPPRNVLQVFTDSMIVTIRPSGTEAKLKLYCQLLPQDESRLGGRELLTRVRGEADAMSRRVYNELLDRIDLQLGPVGLMLPDIVDLDLKIEFEGPMAARLRESLSADRFANLEEVLAWLQKKTTSLTPGSDPLPALRDPLASLCRAWQEEGLDNPLVEELGDWANSS